MEGRIGQLFVDLNADALRFQELYYNERRYLSELDSRRCAGYAEVVQQGTADANPELAFPLNPELDSDAVPA